jgi:hypothetical protein
MKKNIILLTIIVLTQSLSAQNDSAKVRKDRRAWFDFQVTQHIGLNQWSAAEYVNDGLPQATITELRPTFNLYMARPYIGTFVDIGVGFMTAPKMKSLDLDQMPMPRNGMQYYLRELLSESGNIGTTTHFKMTLGFFGKMPVSDNFSIMPYLGVGFLTMPQRKYDIILKEHGSNMQYRTTYAWNNGSTILYYVSGRLNFKYKLSQKSSLLVGLEYMWFLSTIDFYGKYTNTFNANVQRDFNVKGEKMNMLGISVGISFM